MSTTSFAYPGEAGGQRAPGGGGGELSRPQPQPPSAHSEDSACNMAQAADMTTRLLDAGGDSRHPGSYGVTPNTFQDFGCATGVAPVFPSRGGGPTEFGNAATALQNNNYLTYHSQLSSMSGSGPSGPGHGHHPHQPGYMDLNCYPQTLGGMPCGRYGGGGAMAATPMYPWMAIVGRKLIAYCLMGPNCSLIPPLPLIYVYIEQPAVLAAVSLAVITAPG